MIDLALSKKAAMPAHLVGMLYDKWELNMEEEGLAVFIQPGVPEARTTQREKADLPLGSHARSLWSDVLWQDQIPLR